MTWLYEPQVYIQIWLIYAFNDAYVALSQLFKGIMCKLDDISYEWGRDGFLDDILRLDFLADQVYGGAGLLQDFLIELYRPLGG